MHLLLDALQRGRLEGTRRALAGVARTAGTAPLPPGAAMAVAETGEVISGASGDCVDGTVFSVCEQVIRDARPALNRPGRSPDAHEVVTRWPREYLESVTVAETTAIGVLTHDREFDIPLVRSALRGPAGYVGAMGSRRVHAERLELLRAEGLTEPGLSRLTSPIGLDLGARPAEETAVSIAAERVARRRGGTRVPLAHLDVAVHR